ncbi:MAG: cytochrome c [Verrucomicrobia bacterium]|nr:cytochrome c [Verrucomicrobiota bacterium]
MRNVYLVTLFVVALVVSILGFRGATFTKPPIDLFPDWAFPGMEVQPKHRPQAASKFFADGRSDRPPPPHTVARGMLRDDDHLHFGKTASGAFATALPASLTVDRKFLERGQDRYQIYCAPCHGALGDGNGITKRYGMGATPSYHDPRLRALADGEIFNTITAGKNTMMPYADKITPEDRWAVVAYVRALQRAQQGTVADVTDTAAKKALGLP